ncbi:alpha-(1,3)-fucosyltransferase 10-like [Daphnia pulicaria]|uniref:alpha-(1,3)-fucosyltransferase 10-like n=1 Tax=Daphnia pulicaria TaxID=35523 RepID=UPI001EEB8F4A|nr:alpha-(1,3)-fucosyltransferase 10-like [Daphnia pulicaria]
MSNSNSFAALVFTYLVLVQNLTMIFCGWFTVEEKFDSPIILWWTPFTGETGNLRTCGENTCYFTENQTYLSNPKTKVVTFYGSSFTHLNLPIPRQPWHDWALLHEESPKNNPSFCYSALISLFNYTATWSRKSSFPLTLLSLPKLSDITDGEYFIPVAKKNLIRVQEGLSPIAYVQSSCNAPSERDLYVEELQKFIKIDSYGKCLNNKPLPQHLEDPADGMNNEDFFQLMAKYKFTIAFENAIGDDYITEKLWRPLILGSVPIYMGSPSFEDWLPHSNSAVSVRNFTSPESLADYLHSLNDDDIAYSRMLSHKLHGTVDNNDLIVAMEGRSWSAGHEDDFQSENFVEAFECYLCSEIHRKQLEENAGYSTRRESSVDTSHYNCSAPLHPVTQKINFDSWWVEHWNHAGAEANIIGRFALRNLNYTSEEFHKIINRLVKSSCIEPRNGGRSQGTGHRPKQQQFGSQSSTPFASSETLGEKAAHIHGSL